MKRRRYYTAADAGGPCAGGCGRRVPRDLDAAGEHAHPTCGPAARPEAQTPASTARAIALVAHQLGGRVI